MADNTQHPLANSANWTKPKTWVVPLEITCMVDDPEQYDEPMKKIIERIVNELRSICKSFDHSGKQLSINILHIIKSADRINALKGDSALDSLPDNVLEAALEKLLKKKGLA
jgi:hydroxymethylpyrimidine pyrophosphatase-like HAD family hydrolase